MKKIGQLAKVEPRNIALLIGLTIGLGLAVHEFFFVATLVVVLIAAFEWTAQKAHELLRGH